MQIGSLIMLAKPLSSRDYRMAERLGTKLPEKGVPYTLCWGPTLMYCYVQERSVLGIRVEELDGFYDPWFFVEVQEPMKINLDEILIW